MREGPDPDFVLAALAQLMEPAEDLSSAAKAESILARMAGAFLAPGAAAQEAEPRPGPESTDREEDAVVVVDEAGTILSCNPGAERLLGRAASSVVGSRVSTILLARGGATGEALARELLTGEVRGRRADGTTFPIEATLARLPWPAGGSAQVLVLHDRAARLRAEDELRRTQTRYRMLVEQIPAVTFMANLGEGQNEIYIGPQIEALLGFSQQEWLENPVIWYWQLHPEDRARWCAEFARGCQSGGPFRSECRFIARDGRVVWLHGEARVIRDESGRPLFIQGVAFDITETKRAEQQMRDAQETKARHERLAAIGQLAGGVAHDLRNPLGAVRNAWHYVAKRFQASPAWEDPRVQQLSGVMESELARAGRIIGDLLDFARDRQPWRVACPLDDLVRDALAVVVTPGPGVTLASDVPTDLPVPFLDRDQVRQVLVNLIQNAVEAVDPQRGKVMVRARAEGGSEVVLEVRDNGKGITPEVRQKLFEPLFTTKTKGTGLGLAIVSNITHRHGGQVEVESRAGQGTTFRLRLPIGLPSQGETPLAGGMSDLRR